MRWSAACLFAFVLIAVRVSSAEPAERLNPAGIDGAILLVGDGAVADAFKKQFVELAGGEKARLVILPSDKEIQGDKDGEKLEAAWKAFKPASVAVLRGINPKLPAALKDATGIWFGDSPTAAGMTPLAECLQRGGVIAAPGAMAERMGCAYGYRIADNKDFTHFLPNVLIGASPKFEFRLVPGLPTVAITIDPGTALLVKGRDLRVFGEGKVVANWQAGKDRPAKTLELKAGSIADYTTFRKIAIARAGVPFPPKDAPAPEVPHGSLLIVGGGGMPADVTKKFIDLAGGPDALIVVLPVSMPDPIPAGMDGRFLRRAGARNVVVIKARDRAGVEALETLDLLKKAGGIWFDGGRQWRFVDAYAGTKFEPELWNVLKRGGVIGGSSAGASIQGDYLCRGDPLGPIPIMCEGYEKGLGFLPGVGIDQHFTQRKRHPDMTQFVNAYPQMLGIGLDEATAIVVKGQVAEVMGRGKAHFYDRHKEVRPGQPDYEAFPAGARFDLKARKALA